MSKHTPGPWTLSDNGWKTNPYSIVVRHKGVHRTTVANIPERATISEEQKEANARLISAAPDLLEALIGVMKYDGYEIPMPEYKKAHAAIAKATGEST